MESKGFLSPVFNRTPLKSTEKFASAGAKEKTFNRPARWRIRQRLKKTAQSDDMVKAGAPVDAVINQLAPLLEEGDVIIDGGNSLFTDTQRRGKELEDKGIHFVGMGVSGGEEGALKGPSLMPGGSKESWEIIAPIFRKIAAQVDGEPCCRYMGPDGAGHFVKMVHNGIEYGDIQLICEAYAILKAIVEMDAAQLAETFTEWNKGELDSYLIEITSQIFRKIDPQTGKPLVDVILDKAGQKGTGIWTLQAAIRQSVVISTINAAVEARVISSRKEDRVAASEILPQPRIRKFRGNRARFVNAVRDALYASRSFLTRREWSFSKPRARNTSGTSRATRHDLARRLHHPREISESDVEAYQRNPPCTIFCSIGISPRSSEYASVIGASRSQQLLSTAWPSLHFPPHLPISTVTGSRVCLQTCCKPADFFGAHTYERVDKPGVFHTEWIEADEKSAEKPTEPKVPAPHHVGE